MANVTWTITQRRRLKELGIELENRPDSFSNTSERNKLFQQFEKQQVEKRKKQLTAVLENGGRVALEDLTEKLTAALCKIGFIRVTTPTVISKSSLIKMTIDEDHPLNHQIYWLNSKQCLRPMLAPNLYSLMSDFSRIRHRPICFFEIGSCFRKESDGAKHNSEFTMLNLVEMGTPKDERLHRLKELASLVSRTAGLTDYQFESEKSKIYGTTIDVIAGSENIEVASGAIGPHPLDIAWGVTDTWVGLGFGLERLLMTQTGEKSIGRCGKSLSHINGIHLKL
ncbi:MAG: pyrrolysine--tRNA(Pyl) ligase large subunit [Deltaproteobacteria bacterium]|nr:pyrrolysine--tRNA(Pyl) ligase large subunit [Deltaproteobacteria bacterium]